MNLLSANAEARPGSGDLMKNGGHPDDVYFGPDGELLNCKPETMTHLHGRHLVHKDHLVIALRGKLDSLAAQIVAAQLVGHQDGRQRYVDDLGEVLEFVRRLLSCEYTGMRVKDFYLLGFDAEALRECSHNPVKFFGHRHMLTDYRMGPLCVTLNCLRTQAREVELAAFAAFKTEGGDCLRDDLVMGLNRLSSLLYIMMYKYMPEDLEPIPSGI